MKEKTKRVIAIIALVFMGIFTVSFIAFLVNPGMLKGVVAFVALFSGVIGIGLFFVLRMFMKKDEEKKEDEADSSDGAEADEAEIAEETESDDEACESEEQKESEVEN